MLGFFFKNDLKLELLYKKKMRFHMKTEAFEGIVIIS